MYKNNISSTSLMSMSFNDNIICLYFFKFFMRFRFRMRMFTFLFNIFKTYIAISHLLQINTYKMNIKTNLLEENVIFVDNTKKSLVFIIHTHIRLRSTNNTF